MIVYFSIKLKDGTTRQFYETSTYLKRTLDPNQYPQSWAWCLDPTPNNDEFHQAYRFEDIESVEIRAIESYLEPSMGDMSISTKRKKPKQAEYATFEQLPKDWQQVHDPVFKFRISKDAQGNFLANSLDEMTRANVAYPAIYEFVKIAAEQQKVSSHLPEPTVEYDAKAVLGNMLPVETEFEPVYGRHGMADKFVMFSAIRKIAEHISEVFSNATKASDTEEKTSEQTLG